MRPVGVAAGLPTSSFNENGGCAGPLPREKLSVAEKTGPATV